MSRYNDMPSKYQSLFDKAIEIEKQHDRANIATGYNTLGGITPYYKVYPGFYDNTPPFENCVVFRGTTDNPASQHILNHWKEMEKDL